MSSFFKKPYKERLYVKTAEKITYVTYIHIYALKRIHQGFKVCDQ